MHAVGSLSLGPKWGHAVGSGWVHVQAGTSQPSQGLQASKYMLCSRLNCVAKHPLTAVLGLHRI